MKSQAGESEITMDTVAASQEERTLLYDKTGEEHYNVVSAFIKSMRGSDPDAAVYWMMRMLEAGDDPLFVLRRMMIFASEDVGNADPRAARRGRRGSVLPPHGNARGALPAGARLRVPGLGSQIERGERRVASREGARGRVWRAPGAEEAAERGHEADERGGVRRGVQVRARVRRGWSPARRTCPTSSPAKSSTSPASAAKRGESRRASTPSAPPHARRTKARAPS